VSEKREEISFKSENSLSIEKLTSTYRDSCDVFLRREWRHA